MFGRGFETYTLPHDTYLTLSYFQNNQSPTGNIRKIFKEFFGKFVNGKYQIK